MGQREQERQRGKRREDRHERRQTQHSGGGEWDCLRLPEGVEVFKPEKDKTYHIDIIPYIVGAHNKNADKGDEYFELSYPVYRNLGIDEKKYVAIGEFKGVKDPVAEHFAKLRKDGVEWDDMKVFKHTWRQIMLFFVHEEADKGLQMFEGAYGTFGELLDEEINGSEETWIDNFDDPDAGATLVVRFKAKSIGQTNPWILASKINFEEREGGFTADGNKKLAAEVLAKAAEVCLDDLLKIPDYDTLRKALDGEPMHGDEGADDNDAPAPPKKGQPKTPPPDDDDDKEEPTPTTAKGKKKEPEPDDENDAPAPPPKKAKQATAEVLGIEKGGEVEHDEHGTCTVIRIAEDGLTMTLMDSDDGVHKGIDVADVEPVTTKDEDEDEGNGKAAAGATGKTEGKSGGKPANTAEKKSQESATEKSASPSKKKGADEDWDDDWDDDDKKGKKK